MLVGGSRFKSQLGQKFATYFFFLISKLSNILTNKGPSPRVYKGKKNKKEMSRGPYTNHPKQKGARSTSEYT